MTARRSAKRLVWLAAAVLVGGVAAFLSWSRSDCPAQELFERATASIDRGDRSGAVAALDALLGCAPDHHQALLYRGQLAREMGDSERALEYFRRVKTDSAKDAGVARFLEGTILLEQNRAREAERVLLTSAELHPTYPQPRERLVGLYAVQLRAEECREQLDALRRLRPWNLAELIVRQICTEAVYGSQEAIPQLEGYVAADARDVRSRLALARYYLYVDRTAEALGLLREAEAVAEVSDAEQVRGLLAEALALQSELAEARRVLGDSLPPADADLSLWRAHGFYAAAAGEWETSAFCLNRALKNRPDDITALYRLGLSLQRSGEHEEATRVLERMRLTEELYTTAARLLGVDAAHSELRFEMVMQISRLFLQLDRPDDAGLWLEQAHRLKPGDRDVLALARQVQAPKAPPRRTSEPSPAIPAQPAQESVPAVAAVDGVMQNDVAKRSEARDAANGRIRLLDRHEDVNLDFQYFNGESRLKYLLDSTGGGVGVLDYDLDGRPDLYFPQGCTIPFQADDWTYTDRLYRNRGDGTFQDLTEIAGLGSNQYGQGCAAGDYNNDGYSDLFVANYGTNLVYRNNGDGTFADVTAETGIAGERWSASLALADLDSDGRLDLYVATYVLEPLKRCRDRNGNPVSCSPAIYEAEQDLLYRNRGDGTFEDVSEPAGIQAPDGKGLGVIVADLNDDGQPDIYVANDGTPNFLFRNLGGESASGGLLFEEIGMPSGVAVSEYGSPQAGMGIACGDLNGDGRLDLYVTNFLDDVNTLYLNQGDFIFSDATRAAGLAAPTRDVLGFGTQPVDLDLDGNLELFIANGHIDDFRARGEPWKMRPQLFYNLGSGAFAEVSADAGDYFRGEYLGRGVARLDWNGDGRPDLVVVHQDRPIALLENQTTDCGHAVVLELRGVESNRDAIGAKIRVTAGGRTQVRELCGGDGFFASNERREFIGIGSATRIEHLEIRWPAGHIDRWDDLPADSRLVCVETQTPLIHPLSQHHP